MLEAKKNGQVLDFLEITTLKTFGWLGNFRLSRKMGKGHRVLCGRYINIRVLNWVVEFFWPKKKELDRRFWRRAREREKRKTESGK